MPGKKLGPLHAPNAPKPPGYVPQSTTAGQTCSNCKMFDVENGVCTGYGNRPVAAEGWCESWALKPTEQAEAESQLTAIPNEATERFLAPAPVIIPPGSSMADIIKLRYGPMGPPAGTPDDMRVKVAGGSATASDVRDYLKERSGR